MQIRHITGSSDLGTYEDWIKEHPQGSLWQSLAWKQYQEARGRAVHIFIAEEKNQMIASAMVIVDKTSLKLTAWDIPRGPLWSPTSEGRKCLPQLLEFIIARATHDRALQITLSPAVHFPMESGQLKTSTRHEMPVATRIVGLTGSDDAILKQMKQKGRYNIKVAEKHGVVVQPSDDAEAFYELVKETAKRDGFTPPSLKNYHAFLKTLQGSFLLLAYLPEDPDTPIAGLLGVIWNGQGIYYYGASSYEQRAVMAPYLLQWEAMQYCKGRGCHSYDLFGIAPEDDPDHPWKTVSEFKEKFGGSVVTYEPEQQIILKPVAHKLLKAKRRILG